MEKFKIEIFNQEKTGRPFPWFRSLKESETRILRQHLARAIGLPNDVSLLKLTQSIANMSVGYSDLNAEDEKFQLETTIQRLGVIPAEMLYVNWYRYDDIDEMRFKDVAEYFDYLWYPGPDDIDLFDATYSWVLSISHDGYVSGVRLKVP